MKENIQISLNDIKEHQSLTKSRFKYLIDQIELKINCSNKSNYHEDNYLSSSNLKSLLGLSQRSRMLPLYIKNARTLSHDKKNQKQISVNLEFNKLLLHEKKKFVKHSPNDKDLFVTLPQLKIHLNKKIQPNKKDLFQKKTKRWRLKLKVIDRITLLNLTKDQSFLKKNIKWGNQDEKAPKEDMNDSIKVEIKNQQRRKFNLLNCSNQSLENKALQGRFSHKQQRNKLRKIKQNLQKFIDKQNIGIEKENQTSSPLLCRLKLKVLNLERLKMSQTQHLPKVV